MSKVHYLLYPTVGDMSILIWDMSISVWDMSISVWDMSIPVWDMSVSVWTCPHPLPSAVLTQQASCASMALAICTALLFSLISCTRINAQPFITAITVVTSVPSIR